MFQKLKHWLAVWAATHAVMYLWQKLRDAHLGTLLNAKMDALALKQGLTKNQSDDAQHDMAALLRDWANELEA